MSRIAVTLLAAACIAAVQVPATGGRALASQSPALSVRQPVKTKPSPAPTHKPAPPRKRQGPPPVPVPAPALPGPSANCPQIAGIRHVTSVPWAQRALDFTSAWDLTQGSGVTVAVVDSGVDYSPQLAGRVTAIDLTGTGEQDCVGHGTAVAAIIAASDIQATGMPFAGVAPAARILSVKVNNADVGKAITLAQGIRDAAFRGAGVINVSVTTADTADLRSAVEYAQSLGAVIVAAGGNDADGNDGTSRRGPFYPASYRGVLSVGAVASGGGLAPFSDQRSHVAVTAPGVDITSAWPGGYQSQLNGTSFATAFVSGVAALVRSRYPRLSAARVVRRIEDTADGAAGPGTGNGLVNPLQAVSAILPNHAPGASPSAVPAPIAVARRPVPDQAARTAALTATAALLAAALLIALGAVVVRQGRRRRWQAGRMQLPAEADGPVAEDFWS